MFRIAFIGDIVGRPGRIAARKAVLKLQREWQPDCILANAENVAHGKGLTYNTTQELFQAGIQGLTGGNHSWSKKEGYTLLDNDKRIIRPANFKQSPGEGYMSLTTESGHSLTVVNILGRVYMSICDCPFQSVQAIVKAQASNNNFILVDFHAEATSEKQAMGYFLDGKVTAVVGTHTHIQTADARILPKGTAYITDVGMCGIRNSVLGVRTDIIIEHFLTALPARFEPASEGELQAGVAIIDCDEKTKKAMAIRSFLWTFKQ